MCSLRLAMVATVAFVHCLCASFAVAQSNSYDTVVNNGSSANRVDIIFAGDGYQSSELESTYVDHIGDTMDHFFTSQPLQRYQSLFIHDVSFLIRCQ